MPETAYLAPSARLQHAYGDHVHILSDPWALAVLSRLCHPDCKAPVFHDLVSACFDHLLHGVVEQLPTVSRELPTRMTEQEPRAIFASTHLDPEHNVVLVDVARGGILPTLRFQRALHHVLAPERIRVDHVYMQRTEDPDTGAVTGVTVAGSKIGGPVDGASVIIPDPMAATGASMAWVIDDYAKRGAAHQVIVAHLMCTPEYLRRITTQFPEVHIYALRVDRGLSPEDVLAARPGERWSEERGLTDHDYIVPGAGGLGELLNNVWV